jgi:hypothetical protein
VVVRRKPRGYKQGGAVLADVAIPGNSAATTTDELALQPDPAPPPAAGPPPPQFDDAVARAVEGQRRAEELQREYHRQQMQRATTEQLQTSHDVSGLDREAREAQREIAQERAAAMSIEEKVAASPMSERRKAFVLANRELIDPVNSRFVEFYYAQAKNAGVADDSDEMDNHILSGLREELAHLERMRARARENVAPRAALAREEALQPAPSGDAPSSPAMPSQQKKSAGPMVAPPSRDLPPSMSGGQRQGDRTLNPEERQIAAISFPHLPQAQAEFEYWQNRERMRQMKRDGLITDSGR